MVNWEMTIIVKTKNIKDHKLIKINSCFVMKMSVNMFIKYL